MKVSIDQGSQIVRIDAAASEAWTIVNGLQAAADELRSTAHQFATEGEALPLLESADSYESLADRILDEIA